MRRLCTAAATSLALAACASAPPYDGRLDMSAPATVSVRISRPFSGFGAVIPAPVFVNGERLGVLMTGGSTSTMVRPGKLQVGSGGSVATTTADEGYDYLFELSMPVQVWFVSPDFDVRFVSRSPSASTNAAAASRTTQSAVGGVFAYEAEKMARAQQCSPIRAAILTQTVAGAESYDVNCSNGKVLHASCSRAGCFELP